MQIREEVITKKKFVTSDGHEFEFQSDALAHEAELLIKGKVARLTFNGKVIVYLHHRTKRSIQRLFVI